MKNSTQEGPNSKNRVLCETDFHSKILGGFYKTSILQYISTWFFRPLETHFWQDNAKEKPFYSKRTWAELGPFHKSLQFIFLHKTKIWDPKFDSLKMTVYFVFCILNFLQTWFVSFFIFIFFKSLRAVVAICY